MKKLVCFGAHRNAHKIKQHSEELAIVRSLQPKVWAETRRVTSSQRAFGQSRLREREYSSEVLVFSNKHHCERISRNCNFANSSSFPKKKNQQLHHKFFKKPWQKSSIFGHNKRSEILNGLIKVQACMLPTPRFFC